MAHGSLAHDTTCRFAPAWATQHVVAHADAFAWQLLYWEGRFHRDNVALNAANGMTYDGTQLNWTTGERTNKHPFSAASKEALQMMLYARAIDGSQEAARFLTPDNLASAPELAASILDDKLKTYIRFNATYPGFGGFLPWVTTDKYDIEPAWDWVNRVPALDNGELLWAVYACINSMSKSPQPWIRALAVKWQDWFDYAKTTAVPVFYSGQGRVCAVSKISNQSLPVTHPAQQYACEGTALLDDPYEGELFTQFISLFSSLPPAEKDQLWSIKRNKLVKVEYHSPKTGPITVQQGYWFSSHELWKVLEMPYYDVEIVRRLYRNAERARTCNSALNGIAGLYASVNNSTDVATDTISGYISAAGIPSIASQKQQYREVVTPYGAWPTVLVDRAVGLAWWHRMVTAAKMQNPYGSTESTRLDGKLVSALLTWDSKITTVVALLGGVGDLVRHQLKRDRLYRDFISRTENEYLRVFGDEQLKGEHVALCLPQDSVPRVAGVDDFTLCSIG
ncbi:hypothetical protein CDD81_6945 [Ophiocordyceps australis]|uniref:Endo-beta-1,2-glucanase SGL domain-containing protein n=1 Tax=Ophiocordyceps australis TaxID=1399860 RepID=A0A2C5YG52_9HYPO|nr:hypothetical protein CDD81_6945 [Ophiocordyceps australis]